MIEKAPDADAAKLQELQTKEMALWHTIELEISRRGGEMARSIPEKPAGAERIFETAEDLRAVGLVIAHALRELTMIIRQEVLVANPSIAVDSLAAEVDTRLKAKIDVIFGPHQSE